MTDRRAVTLSLIPIVALVVLVGISVTTAVVGGGSTITATPPSVPAPAPASSSAQGDAADWLATNAGDGGVVIVDAPMASELFLAGWPSADILTVGEDATAPWREAAYVVSSAGIRDAVGEDPNVAAALLNSVAVARFGDENAGTQVRRITPEGVTAAAIAEGQATAEHREFGGQLSRNPALIVSTPDRVAFAGGRVDSRISLVIGALVATGSVTVNDLPVVPGESGEVLRTVAISAVGDTPLVNDGAPTAQAAEVFEGLSGAYAVDDLTVRGDALVLTFPLLSPSNP